LPFEALRSPQALEENFDSILNDLISNKNDVVGAR